MLSIQVVRGLPHLSAPGIVPCIHHRHTSIFLYCTMFGKLLQTEATFNSKCIQSVWRQGSARARAPQGGGADSVSRYPLAGFTGPRQGKKGKEKTKGEERGGIIPPSTDFSIRHCRPMLLQRYSCIPACVSSVSLNHTPQSFDSPVSSIITLSITVCH